jgi:TatD DNase family protein
VIDFHCHIDLYSNPVTLVDQIVQKGVYVLAVTTTPKAWRGTNAVVGNSKRIRVGLGLHPELVAQRHSEVDLLCSLVPEARYVGEVGLDGSTPHRASLALQEEVLRKVLLACTSYGGRILSLHSRGAVSSLLGLLTAHPLAGVPVLHWFAGTPRELQRASAMGCWFSVGPAMLRGQKGRELVAAMPRDRVLTETDGPFARKGKDPLMPWDVIDAESTLADVWELPVEQVRATVLANFRRLAVTGPQADPESG